MQRGADVVEVSRVVRVQNFEPQREPTEYEKLNFSGGTMSRFNPEIHNRRSIRLDGFDYSQTGMYFVTICSHKRLSLFGKIANGEMILNDMGEIVHECWNAIPVHFPDVILHENIIMPNHVHGIIQIVTPTVVRVQNFEPQQRKPQQSDPIVRVQNFEPQQREPQQSTPQRNKYQHIIPRSIGSIIRGFKIGTTKRVGYSIWQRNFHDRIIRNENEFLKISEYIKNNPKNWNDDIFLTE